MGKVTPGFLSNPIVLADVREVLQGKGWVSLTRLVAMLEHKIPPAAAVRCQWHSARGWNHKGTKPMLPLLERIARGKRAAVRRTAGQLAMKHHDVEVKKGNAAREPVYRLIEGKESSGAVKKTSSHKATPRRQHAAKGAG